MERRTGIGHAVERLWQSLESQKMRSGWETKLKCAGYMKHRDDYDGTMVPKVSLHDSTAIECFSTYVDGFIGFLMPQDDDWFRLMPRGAFHTDKRDKEYGGFAPVMDEEGVMELMDELTDVALREFSDSGMYEPAKAMFTDSESMGFGVMISEDDGEGHVVYREIDPQECCIAEDSKRNVDVFVRHFKKSPIDLVREFRDAKLEHCWERVKRGNDAEECDVEVYEAILPRDYLYNPEDGSLFDIDGDDARVVKHVVWVPSEEEVVHEGSFNEMPVVIYSPSRDSDKTPYGKGIVNKYIEEIVRLDDMQNMKLVLMKRNANPPMLVHQSLRGNYSSKAGAQVYTGDLSSQGAVPIFKEGSSNNYNSMVNDLQTMANHIRALMNADLFRTVMGSTDSRKTAYEVSEMKNEALTLLSMKVANFSKRVVEPLVKRTLKIKVRAGVISVNGKTIDDVCAYIDKCSVMMDSVFVRRLQGYLRYQGLLAGLQFLGAYAQLEQTQSIGVLEGDRILRSGLYGAGFPAYGIKSIQKLNKERKAQEQAQAQMMQSQMAEQNSKALANTGKGMQNMRNAGMDDSQMAQLAGAIGGGYGQQ